MSAPLSLNEVAFSTRFLEVVGPVPGAFKDNLCQIQCPNDYFEEENDGFIIQDLERSDFYMVVNEISEHLREMATESEFFVVEWKDFGRYFRLLDDKDCRVMKYIERQKTVRRERKEEICEKYHWVMALFATICFMVGVLLLLSGTESTSTDCGLLLGLLLMSISGVGAVVTSGYGNVDHLSRGRKLLGWLPVLIGGLFAFGIMLLVLSARTGPGKQ